MKKFTERREVLKGYSEKLLEEMESGPEDERLSDQQKGLPVPPMQNSYPEDAKLIDLIPADQITVGNKPLFDIIRQRKSLRKFSEKPLSLEEISFLLYATQGVRRIIYDKTGKPHSSLRTTPSGGARHAFETYLLLNRVDGIEPGLYRYLPLDHKLCFLYQDATLPEKMTQACCDQRFVGESAAVFVWTAVPYRMEWRYRQFSYKTIIQDSGHLCQNLYLASEAIECGTCAIGAYLQEKMDELLGVDGTDEMTIYVSPVGKV